MFFGFDDLKGLLHPIFDSVTISTEITDNLSRGN